MPDASAPTAPRTAPNTPSLSMSDVTAPSMSGLSHAKASLSRPTASDRAAYSPVCLTFPTRDDSDPLTDETNDATLFPATTMPEENRSMAPAMASGPMASMTEPSALDTRFPTLVMAVPMPLVELRACCSNDAMPSMPSLSRVMRAALKSSMVKTPSFMAWYRSLDDASAPIMALAMALSWPGMTSCRVRQSSISGLPFARAWVYCTSARSTSTVEAPPASSASLSAMDSVVA